MTPITHAPLDSSSETDTDPSSHPQPLYLNYTLTPTRGNLVAKVQMLGFDRRPKENKYEQKSDMIAASGFNEPVNFTSIFLTLHRKPPEQSITGRTSQRGNNPQGGGVHVHSRDLIRDSISLFTVAMLPCGRYIADKLDNQEQESQLISGQLLFAVSFNIGDVTALPVELQWESLKEVFISEDGPLPLEKAG
ncbi:hypothetical protein EYF80_012932 [Liparis tanakae]|uniref:Uncharacterized protein n=1 Tax=Liparis tanakae TaxID=230148 RepID=A0A4Z2IFQ4_9TELE|nr:hypothetical protein EYF80_012932 [Liparis tanakae]